MAYDQYGNWIPDQSGAGGSSQGSGGGGNWWDTPYGSPLSQNAPQTGLGYSSFNIPSGQQQGQGASGGGYSSSQTGYNQGQGGQVPSQYQPTGLPQQASGYTSQALQQYLQAGGLAEQQHNYATSNVATGVQNYTNLLSTLGIPTGMTGARQVADIAAGGASTEQKQQTQDMLSALQGQRGTGAGLGSNVDQLMATALGTQSANMRSTYANALVSYLQNQAQTAASGSKSLSPSA